MKRVPQLGIWALATVVLASLAALAVTWVVVRHSHPHHHQHSSSEGGFHQWLHQNLEISEEQERNLKPFEDAYETERKRLLAAIKLASTRVADAIRESERDSPEVRSALLDLNEVQGELQQATIDHFFTMKEHLEPDQAEKLIEWTRESILHGSDH